MIRLTLALCLLLLLSGCADVSRAAKEKRRVTLYSGGVAVRTWTADGDVEYAHALAWFFDENGNRVYLSGGSVVVEREPE